MIRNVLPRFISVHSVYVVPCRRETGRRCGAAAWSGRALWRRSSVDRRVAAAGEVALESVVADRLEMRMLMMTTAPAAAVTSAPAPASN